MSNLHMPATSHTVVLSQLAELERALMKSAQRHDLVTANELGLKDVRVLSRNETTTLPDGAVLEQLWWDGPSEYPFVHASFRIKGSTDSVQIDLHTASLQALSHRLQLRHSWGF
jgi:hypothetical protein